MKAYEIITEGPLDKLGKLSKVFSKEQPPRVEPNLGKIGGAVNDELSAAKQWYNSLKTKPQTDSGLKDQFGRPIMRNMTDDEILNAYKQSDAYKKSSQALGTADIAKIVANEVANTIGKKAPAEIEKAGMHWLTKILGAALGSALMKALTTMQLLWSLVIYLRAQERIEKGDYEGYTIKDQKDKNILLDDARGKLYQAWLSQIAAAGIYLLHIWILFFTRGKINKLEALQSFAKTTAGYTALQTFMATQAWNDYAIGLFHYLINSTRSQGYMSNTSVAEFWDDSAIINALIKESGNLYKFLSGIGVPLGKN